MALTANRELNRYVDQELRTLPVAASAHIYKGALVGINRATGYARNLVANDVFAGIAYEEMDNSAGLDGDLSVRLYTQGDFVLTTNNATQAWVGAPVYAADSEVTGVIPVVGASYCGLLMAVVGTNLGIVRIQPMAAPQVERQVQTQLTSLTTAPTTNQVMIVQRAIKVISMQVSFNTVPDAGTLSVGTHNSNPTELVNAFNLTTLTAHVPAVLTPNLTAVAAGLRVYGRITQATATPGVGGVFSMRYIELP